MGHSPLVRSLLLLLLLAGLGACATARPEGPPPDQGLDGPFRFTLERTGGFVPLQRQVELDSTSRTITLSPGRGLPARQATLLPEDIQAFRDRLKSVGFLDLKGPFLCPACADQFHFTATLSLENRTHTVVWDYFGGTPGPLRELTMHVTGLTGRYFPDQADR